jgi:hypothetical protein
MKIEETCRNCSKKGEGGEGRKMEGVNLRYIVGTYVNITMYFPPTTITC